MLLVTGNKKDELGPLRLMVSANDDDQPHDVIDFSHFRVLQMYQQSSTSTVPVVLTLGAITTTTRE
jgi:hypothetical protein